MPLLGDPVMIFLFTSMSGENGGIWFLDLKSGSGGTGKGQPPGKADVVMAMDSADFSKMFSGERSPR